MFDAVLYINLAHRTDRKELILQEIQKIKNIDESQIYRIDAVLEPMCGHIGCGKSHINALELAIQNNWSSVLVWKMIFVSMNIMMTNTVSTKFKTLNGMS